MDSDSDRINAIKNYVMSGLETTSSAIEINDTFLFHKLITFMREERSDIKKKRRDKNNTRRRTRGGD